MKTNSKLFTLSFLVGVLLALLVYFTCDVRADSFSKGLPVIDNVEPTLDPIIKQERKGPTLIVHYESGAVITNSLYLGMSESAKERIQQMADDRDTLAAARALAQSLKKSHPEEVATLSDPEIVAASKTVLDNSKSSGAAGAAVGAALATALAAAGNRKKTQKEKQS